MKLKFNEMKRNIVYYIDEADVDLRTNSDSLKDMFGDADIVVIASLPFRDQSGYNDMVCAPNTAAFILDQRMKGSGIVNYNGTDLASHIRTLDPLLPVYILTGYASEPDEFSGVAHRVEDIIDKADLRDPLSEEAQTLRARILRRVGIYKKLLEAREQRFHDLLIKSLREPLSEAEQKEMDEIEGESTAPLLAAERNKERELADAVDKLRKLVDGGHLPF